MRLVAVSAGANERKIFNPLSTNSWYGHMEIIELLYMKFMELKLFQMKIINLYQTKYQMYL